jgi:hypothetical protein
VWKEREIRKLGRIEAEQRMRRRLREPGWKNYWKIGEDEVSLSFNYLIVNQPLDKSNG